MSTNQLHHVVLFAFKETCSHETISKIERAFSALPSRIEEIQDFRWGTDVSVENKAQGFTHCFLVIFASEKERDRYLPHPAHQEFVSLVGPHVDKVLVFDFFSSG
jgi:hypothetical protein